MDDNDDSKLRSCILFAALVGIWLALMQVADTLTLANRRSDDMGQSCEERVTFLQYKLRPGKSTVLYIRP